MSDYSQILVFISLGFLIGLVLLIVPFFSTKTKAEKDKLDQYECGVEPINGSRVQFEIQFYLVGMVFVIFDVEMSLLIPWALNIKSLGLAVFCTAFTFIALLIAGLFYEWKKGLINW